MEDAELAVALGLMPSESVREDTPIGLETDGWKERVPFEEVENAVRAQEAMERGLADKITEDMPDVRSVLLFL